MPPVRSPGSALRDLIHAQTGTAHGDATAFLRGAANTDPRFRDAVIAEMVENPHRIPPPSFGFDLVAVVKECLAVRRRQVVRGLIMLAIPLTLAPVALFAPLVITLVLVLVGWVATAFVDRLHLLRRLQLFSTGREPDEWDRPSQDALLRRLGQQQQDPDVVYSDYTPFVGAGLELDYWSFAIELVPEGGDPLSEDLTGVVTERPARLSTGLTVPAIHARMRRDLLRLGEIHTRTSPGDQSPTISIVDYVFKSGIRLGPARDWSGSGPGSAFARMAPAARREAAQWLGVPDGTEAPPNWWADAVDLAANERLRHYLAVRVSSWNDEVILTVFTRVQIQGGLLFLENRAFLLPPIARRHHEALETARLPTGAGAWAELLLGSVGAAFILAGRAIPDICRELGTRSRTARNQAWYREMCRQDRPVDHSPTCSIRELAAEGKYQQLFQEMDERRFMESIKTRILTAVHGCLHEHGYRTDEYDARRNVVINNSINNGIQVLNGNVTGNVQTGSHAQATYQQVRAPSPRVGTDTD